MKRVMTAKEALKYIADYSNYAHDSEIRLPEDEIEWVHVSDFASMILDEIDKAEYDANIKQLGNFMYNHMRRGC